MPHEVFSKNQGSREAVGGELPRMMSREGSRNSFGEGRLDRVLVGVTPLGSRGGDSLVVGGFNHSWGGTPYLTRVTSKDVTITSR